MKKVIQVWYLEEHERRLVSDFHTGIMYQLEDGTMVHKMSTDMVADKIVPPLGSPVGSINHSELDQPTPWQCGKCTQERDGVKGDEIPEHHRSCKQRTELDQDKI